MKRFLSISIFLLAAVFLQASERTAIINATLVTVSGDTIFNGTLLIEDGKIKDLGHLQVPEGFRIINAENDYVYPGMTDCATTLGLYEVGSVAATVDSYEMGDYNPHIKAFTAINPHSVHFAITRVNGITNAMAVPRGSLVMGQAVMLNLDGTTPEEMAVKKNAAIAVSFPQLPRAGGRRRQESDEARSQAAEKTVKAISELTDFMNRARRYDAAWVEYDEKKRPFPPVRDWAMEAMIPVIRKQIPLLIYVEFEKDIYNALNFLKDADVAGVLAGVSEGWKAADSIAAAGVHCVVGPVLRTPDSKDPYNAVFANAGLLHKAGVKIAFLTGSAPDVRSLPFHAGTAAAFGLPKEAALRAVTLNPAVIFGLEELIGSLEKGKLANLFVADGDPLEMRTQIKHLFINGRQIDLRSKHVDLYEEFKDRR